MTFGVDWWNLLGQLGAAAENAILIQVRQVIAQTQGIVSIDSVDVILDSGNRKLTIRYTVNDIYGQFNGSVQPTS